jgi:hypothetical protein
MFGAADDSERGPMSRTPSATSVVLVVMALGVGAPSAMAGCGFEWISGGWVTSEDSFGNRTTTWVPG